MKKYVESLDVGRVPVSHVESPRILSLSVPPRHCWTLTLAPWPAPNQRLRWWSPAGCRGRSSSARICPRKFVFCTRWRRKLGASGLASFEGHVNFIQFEVSDGSNNFMGHAVTCDKKLYGRRTIMCWTKDLDLFCIFCPYALTPGWPTRERHIQLEDFLEVGGMLGIYQPTRFFFFKCIRPNNISDVSTQPHFADIWAAPPGPRKGFRWRDHARAAAARSGRCPGIPRQDWQVPKGSRWPSSYPPDMDHEQSDQNMLVQ